VPARTFSRVDVLRDRSVRRHLEGPDDLSARLVGCTVLSVRRRGKFLWFPLDSGEALLAHLGMSGQLLMQPPEAEDEAHLRVRFGFTDQGRELRFVDQRTFGGVHVQVLDGDPHDPGVVPPAVAHIARDPMDAAFDVDAAVAAIRRRRTGLKRALLDQTVVSGIGNIYADEALWRSRLHYARLTSTLPRAKGVELLGHVREVMEEALAQGGTSFDSLYVDVNGSSGYFDRSLAAYGQADLPCPRCGATIVREPFMNRSSYRCPRCQRVPRAGAVSW
jgi:formamidopyrimidine-DNA glycosylase